MKTESARRDRRIRTMPAIGFALIMLFVSVQSANAQWTPPSSSPSPNTNIYYNSGNVGVGTTSPGNKLAVMGGDVAIGETSVASLGGNITTLGVKGLSTGRTGGLRLRSSDNSLDGAFYGADGAWYLGSITNHPLLFTINNVEQMRIAAGGNVGIGTTSPSQKLSVSVASDYQGVEVLGTQSPAVIFTSSSGNSGARNWLISTNANSYGDFAISKSASQGTSAAPNVGSAVLTILNSGKVGIGVNNPAVALDVLGDIQASGVIKAKYQDLAEWVPSSEQLPTGTVVVLDSTKSNQVTSSSVSYDTRVAGVVSEQPGIALGEKSDSKVLVATTGRVKVKVDASKGAIHIGDLLVTSDIPGVAMKSEPVNLGGVQIHRPGTLIGKALEPLEKGKGEILALLSLQ